MIFNTMKEYKDKTIPELMKLVSEKRENLRKFRFGSSGAAPKNVKESRTAKKEIARIFTEISIRGKVSVPKVVTK